MYTIADLQEQAIDLALKQEYAQAIIVNQQILEQDGKNVDALLRLAFCYRQKHQLSEASKYYKIVQKIQPHNKIAQDFLSRILYHAKPSKESIKKTLLDPSIFLEIPKATKTVTLTKLGQKSVLAQLAICEKVILIQKKHTIEVRTEVSNDYIGTIPEDISMRLCYMMNHHSSYIAVVQNTNFEEIKIFLKEEKKGRKVDKMSSFPTDALTTLAGVQDRIQAEEYDENNSTTTTVENVKSLSEPDDLHENEHNDELEEDSSTEDLGDTELSETDIDEDLHIVAEALKEELDTQEEE